MARFQTLLGAVWRGNLATKKIEREKWSIYRLELIFLNPEEHRWQVFQYWPKSGKKIGERKVRSGEAVYRAQAMQLLHYVYQAAQDKFCNPAKASSAVIDTKSIWTQMLHCISGDLSDTEKVKLLTERLQQNCLRIQKICEDEGIPAGHRQVILKIIKSIGPEGETFPLTSPQALDLVSALYVAHDWDVWGRLAFPLKAEGNQWPINAARLGSFSYVIDYPNEDAKNILGYRVDLLCAAGTRIPPKDKACRKSKDWSGIYESYAKFGPMAEYGDYFTHCYDVEKHQRDSYRLYGHLIDQVAKSVAKQRTIFIRCFPLRICGYDHFIQVLLKPNEPASIDDRGVDLPKVFSNPEKGDPKGKPPELLILKECLREMIVQMHIAAFQRAIVAELEKRRSDEINDVFTMDLFAEHAPNLVRMTRIWVNGYGYTYAPTPNSDSEQWVRTEEGDNNWENFGADEEDKRFLTMTCGIQAHVPWEGDFEPLSALLGGTGKMRLEEQWDWLGGAIKQCKDAKELKQLRSKSARRSRRNRPHSFNPG